MKAFGNINGDVFTIYDGGAVVMEVPVGAWVPVNVSNVVSLLDGRVLSIQPNGRVEVRPAGTQGAYEVPRFSGDLAIYEQSGPFAWPWACK